MLQHRQHLLADAVVRELPKNCMDVSHWSWQILRRCLQSGDKRSGPEGHRPVRCWQTLSRTCRHQLDKVLALSRQVQPDHDMGVPCCSLQAVRLRLQWWKQVVMDSVRKQWQGGA